MRRNKVYCSTNERKTKKGLIWWKGGISLAEKLNHEWAGCGNKGKRKLETFRRNKNRKTEMDGSGVGSGW